MKNSNQTQIKEQDLNLDLGLDDLGLEPEKDTIVPSSLERGIIYRKAKEKFNNFVDDPRNLAAVGAGALMLGGLDVARRSNKKNKQGKRPGFLKRTVGTLAGLGLAGAGAYGGYRMMKNPVSENYNPYASALKPSAVLGGTGALAAGLSAFPIADAITSGIPNETVRNIANVGSKALLSTVGSGLAGYGGWKVGKAIEDAEAARRKKEAQKNRNKYLPDFYYDNFA